ncbi:hypothetical protein DOY81_009546 [Sarcophaga bullata]|nr:hypothetical protein DOY81_009546 [Sarcophaga bullata]
MCHIKLYIVGILIACSFYSGVKASDCDGTNTNSFSLCYDFQTIRNLAPRQSVLSLIQSHMSSDSRFRKAVNYMLSVQFKTTTQMIDDSSIYRSLLNQFSDAGVNTTDINSISKIFDCILIPYIREATGSQRSVSSVENFVHSRSLDTFIEEFNKLIPKDSLIRTLKNLLAESDNFTEFYALVREPSFQSQVKEAFKNREIARPIKILRRNQIDLCNLVQYGFNLLNMGPSI